MTVEQLRQRLAELSERERRLRLLAESAPDLIWTTSPDGRVIYANPYVERFLGFTQQEAVGQPLERYLSPESVGLVTGWYLDALEGGHDSFAGEVQYLHRDGHLVPGELRATVERDDTGRVVALHGVSRDISQRKEVERQLRRERDFTRSILDATPAIVLVLDSEGRIVRFNRFMESLSGHRLEEVKGQSWFDTFVPQDLRDEVRRVFRLVVQGQDVQGRPDRMLTREGERLVEWWSRTLANSEDGRTLVTAVGLDATERMRIEEQLRQTQRLESVGQLAGGVAHDFNNMLTVILSYCELIGQSHSEQTELAADLGEIRGAAQRAQQLTRQLLAFSRRQVLEPEVLDLDRVVASVAKLLRRVIGENIELVTRSTPGLGRVLADPGQLEQVIINLAANARDAMAEGGRLVIETTNAAPGPPGTATGEDAAEGPHVMLAISDTGCGMDQQTAARIFEPFFTTKERGKGTGLGLATVYGVVRQSGGQITVESTPGAGTTFRIYLPRVEGPPRRDARPSAERRPLQPGGQETVLVVEDEPGLRQLVVKVLARLGYTVLDAADYHQALELSSKATRIDLLLSDVVLPGPGGLAVMEQVSARHPGARVLFISGYTDRDFVQPEGSGLLTKPFTPSSLGRCVRELLDGPCAE